MAVSTPSTAALWTTFAARAEGVAAVVLRAPSQDAAAALLRERGDRPRPTASLGRHFPAVAAACAAPSDGAGHAPEVVAAAEFAVAETGSLGMNEPNADRAACFLADTLWVVVSADRLVPTLDAAIERLRALIAAGAHHPTLMTGPSRTADIERVLTVGVHGPRRLMVVVVETP